MNKKSKSVPMTSSPLNEDVEIQDRKRAKTLSGGNVDSASGVEHSGEEGVGGSMPSPDQDDIDEMGESIGLTYEDDEPLRGEKMRDRDSRRWELDPASSEDFEERQRRLQHDEDMR
ncbi:MAG: hypothetical protein NPIRA04_11760 [Nitrospirales bacterium]|nr:MAG: hypothetical protein NPIRA04_11760 [Nitrospirales bacterium]